MSDNKGLWAEAVALLGEAEVSRRFRVWIRGIIKKELVRRKEKAPDELFLDEAVLILEDLNKRTGRQYRPGKENLALIRARLADGYSVDDFRAVHKVMSGKWLGDEKMRDYVRPSTLYRPGHFGEYLALCVTREAVSGAGVPADGADRSADFADKKEKAEKAEKAERDLIERLMGRSWWEFETWAEFMRWTVQLPDAKSVAKYEMPERIRRMRTAPGMVMNVLKGRSPEWAEAEYKEIKRMFPADYGDCGADCADGTEADAQAQ